MKLDVWPTPDAEAHILQLGAWWRANRPSVPGLFKKELARIWKLLARSPHIGQPYDSSEVPNVRRVRLKKTPYHVYYLPRVGSGEVIVLAVWGAMRGHGPPLRLP